MAASSVTVDLAALRFFSDQNCQEGRSRDRLSENSRACSIDLSQEEVARRINAPDTSFYRTLPMTLSATGAPVMFVTKQVCHTGTAGPDEQCASLFVGPEREVLNAIRQSRIRWNRVLGFWKHSCDNAFMECEPLYLVDDSARRL